MRSAIYLSGDPVPAHVVGAPDQVVAILEAAEPDGLVAFVGLDEETGNSRTIYVRARAVACIAPIIESDD